MSATADNIAERLRQAADSESIPLDGFQSLIQAVFEAAGLGDEDARIATEVATFPQQTGSSSHGVVTMPLYLTGLVEGTIDASAPFEPQVDRPGAALVDAQHGLGLIVGHRSMMLACDLAARSGVGAVSVRRSSHFGTAGYFSYQATQRGMIGLAMSNASPAIAPTGGVEALLGTNPISGGVPRVNGDPMIHDMATSMVARSRIRQSLAAGEPQIPEGWAIDRNGEPTTNAAEAIEGSVLPIGGAKGYGLALLVEMLCSGLSDAEPGFDITYEDVVSRPSGISHFFLSIDPQAFCGAEAFSRRVDNIAGVIENSKPGTNGPGPRLPGGRGLESARQVRANGVAMHKNLRNSLLKSAGILETKARGGRAATR